METFDIISGYQIEIGDQLIIYGEPVEVRGLVDELEDKLIVSGYSHTTGDKEIYTVNYDDRFEVWGI